jgi:hypothetical protein
VPLTDSMEKPPAAERTAGPIAVFSNSYARLPEHFFARLSPTPVAKPRLIKFNESLAAELLRDKSRPPGIPPAPRRKVHPSSSTPHVNRPPW